MAASCVNFLIRNKLGIMTQITRKLKNLLASINLSQPLLTNVLLTLKLNKLRSGNYMRPCDTTIS